jgi:hypothetical protein
MKVIYKILRKAYVFFKPDSSNFGRNWKMYSNKEYANTLIYNQLMADEPCMIARFGSTELAALVNYIGIKQNKRNIKTFITGNSLDWEWKRGNLSTLYLNAGVFPKDTFIASKFSELILKDTEQVNILGSWLKEEKYIEQVLLNTKRVMLEDLEPFFTTNPWTSALEGKKVLVVHPFAETIEKQYAKREVLFDNGLLPAFQLKTIKAVQSVAGAETEFEDWFEALDHMKSQIDASDYDICIIGCGAYGFPLAAHVKRTGKKAIHMAGATQLLFGIKGKRWEKFIVWPYMNLFNEHWVRPGDNEKPKNANVVEGACYW